MKMTPQIQTKQLPKGWKEEKLGNLADYINGRGFKKSEWKKKGLPIIRIQNLTGRSKEFNYFNGDIEEKNIVYPGDLLMSWSATLDVYFWKQVKSVLNQHIFKVVPKINKIFLYYLLKTKISEMYSKTHGTGMVHITKDHFENIIVNIPESLPLQSLIVSEIETQFTRLDAAVKSLKAVKQKLEIYRKAVLKKAFEKKEGWEEKKLKYLVEEINSGYACGRHAKSGEGLVHFRPYNITPSGNISYELVKIVDPNFSDKRLKYGDIIFNNTNSQVWVGKTCAYDKNEEVGFSNHMTRIRINKDLLNFKYLAKYLHFLFQKGFYYKIMKSHVNQSSVNIDRLQEIDIPHPKSLQEQQSIVSSIESKFSIIDKVEQVVEESLKKTEKLRKSILKAAFEGKLVKVVNENG